jgi:integrase
LTKTTRPAAHEKEGERDYQARLTLIRAVIVAIDTGMRVSEICQMQWRKISFERKEVHIPKERANRGRTVEFHSSRAS